MPYHGNYKVATHTRINDGTSSDLSQSLGQRPGWVLGIQGFSISSVGITSLFVYDTSGSVSTTLTPVWQGIIPYSQSAASSISAGGAGFTIDFSNGITLNNGLAYAISSGNTPATLSTMPSGQVKIDIQFVTSSCL